MYGYPPTSHLYTHVYNTPLPPLPAKRESMTDSHRDRAARGTAYGTIAKR